MTTWFASDHHFLHRRIREIARRPFDSDDEMTESIIERHNALVGSQDTTYFLGDFGLGGWMNSVPLASRLNGKRILVCGNHDQPFIHRGKGSFDRVFAGYLEHFHEIRFGSVRFGKFTLSHFPYDGDSQREERYDEHRPVDLGYTLIHGHVHEEDPDRQITFSSKGTKQIHVGVDGRDFRPVSIDQIHHEDRS